MSEIKLTKKYLDRENDRLAQVLIKKNEEIETLREALDSWIKCYRCKDKIERAMWLTSALRLTDMALAADPGKP